MEEAPVTAATGALGPVIAKLAALLGTEYKLRWCTRRDVKFIRSKLKPVHSVLWNIWEREELDEASKTLKMEALDLADDVEDAIDDFILSMEPNRRNKRLVQTKIKASPFQGFKKRASDVSRRCRSKWEKKRPSDDSRCSKPRAYPFVRRDPSELVGMVEQRDELIQHLVGEEETTPVELPLKTVFIYGTAGMGKTTLANLLYEAIRDKFQIQAFVSLNPGGNTREVLARILEQVAPNSRVSLGGPEADTQEEHLIHIISNFLKDKRYIVIIDDIWNLKELDIVMQSLPKNNLGSIIVGTTRIRSVVEKWYSGCDKPNAFMQTMLPEWDSMKGWFYNIGKENIATGMVAMMADFDLEGFDYEHPIVQMCGGTPLAVRCMLSAVTDELEKQAQQGLHAKACDVQDEIQKHVMENGIQNTPGFEAFVESLQLLYDHLSNHMIKTCLLYCSIYPDGHIFEKDNLVRRWISEGFSYIEKEANCYFEELVNKGFIMNDSRMHPMMQNFLRCKSHQDNFITWSSEITPSNNNNCRIRRLCIYKYPSVDSAGNQSDPLSGFDWYHVRSLTVHRGIKLVPFEKLERVRLLDLCGATDLLGRHWKDICGLVRLRHLLGFNGDGNSETPSEKVNLQCLETFEASGEGFTRLPGIIGNLLQLNTLEVKGYAIEELPREIGALQQLRTLKIKRTQITELPREVWSLQQLNTLDITNTLIKNLPKEIGKLQHLEHLLMSDTHVAKIPRELGLLKELKSLKFDNSIASLPLEVCHASMIVEFPECIRQTLKKSDVVSELAREMLSFQTSGGLVIGAIQMHIPLWTREHFNDIGVLDIRICRLEEQGLKILREMPRLKDLTLRFEVVPKVPVVINNEGFAKLRRLTVDSRVPRLTFQEGSMQRLRDLAFEFQFYGGPPNKDPMGINHLRSLEWICFRCNEDWYEGDSPCIGPTIDVVWKEAQELPGGIYNRIHFKVCGRTENIISGPSPSHAPPLPPQLHRRAVAVGEVRWSRTSKLN